MTDQARALADAAHRRASEAAFGPSPIEGAEGSDEPIAVTLTRAEWGRVLQSIRGHRHEVERKTKRDSFDPVLGAGQLRALEQLSGIYPKLKAQVR